MQPVWVRYLAFPDNQNFPAESSQPASVLLVPPHVAVKPSIPEGLVVCRPSGLPASGVAMPEAAVDKNDLPMPGQHDVRCARQVCPVKAIPKSQSVQQP